MKMGEGRKGQKSWKAKIGRKRTALDGGGLCADCGEIKPRRGRFVKVSGIELFLWHSLLAGLAHEFCWGIFM
jgi:hypothetical protein